MAAAMASVASGGGGTTLTKVFVGGLPWETRGEGVRAYFQQFGEILEAVVIVDKATGRSKGYGFVTFREAEAAMRACLDPSPVIEGRRANCNLAYLGAQLHKSGKAAPPLPPPLLQPYDAVAAGHFHGMMLPAVKPSSGGAAAMSFPAADHGIQQGIPAAYSVYGYSPYFSDYSYQQPRAYYQPYGGMQAAAGGGGAQYYQVFNGGAAAAQGSLAVAHDPSGGGLYPYPYLQYASASPAAAAEYYSMMMMQQYDHYPQMYMAAVGAPASPTVAGIPLQYGGGAMALGASPAGQAAAGIAMSSSLTAPTLTPPMAPVQYQHKLVSSHHLPASAAAVPDQKKPLD